MARKKYDAAKGGHAARMQAQETAHGQTLEQLRRILVEARQVKRETGKFAMEEYLYRVKSLPAGRAETNEVRPRPKKGQTVRPGDFQFFHEVGAFLSFAKEGQASDFPDIDQFVSALQEQMKAEAESVDILTSVQRGEAGHNPLFFDMMIEQIADGLRRVIDKPITEWKVTSGKSGKAIDVERTRREVKALLDGLASDNTSVNLQVLMDDQKNRDALATRDYIKAGTPIVDQPRHQMLVAYEKLRWKLIRPPTTEELRRQLEKSNANFRSMADSQFRRTCRELRFRFTPVTALRSVKKKHAALRKNAGCPPTPDEFRPFVKKSESFQEIAALPDDQFIAFWTASGLTLRTGK